MGVRGQRVVGGTQTRKHRDTGSKSDPGHNLTFPHSGPQVPHLLNERFGSNDQVGRKGENVK